MKLAYEDYRERAAKIQSESFVYDYSPLGEPFIPSPGTDAAMRKALDASLDVPDVLRKMAAARLGELETTSDVREQVRTVWRQSGVNGVQVTLGGIGLAPSEWSATIRDAAYWQRRVRASDDMALCTTADELTRAADDGRVGIVLGTQDTGQIGTDLGALEMFYDFGVRVMQLTYNSRNLIGDGCTEREQSGLSKFGLQVVSRMNELGIIPDVSHSGYRTTLDTVAHSERPVAITHSSCKAVADHPRAKSDDQLRELRDNNGYLGIVAVPFFLAPEGNATVETMARHVEHAAGIVGIERVGIATDWGLWSTDFPADIKQMAHDKFTAQGFSRSELPPFGSASIEGFDTWESWPNITAALLARGFSDEEVRGLIGANALDFLRRAL